MTNLCLGLSVGPDTTESRAGLEPVSAGGTLPRPPDSTATPAHGSIYPGRRQTGRHWLTRHLWHRGAWGADISPELCNGAADEACSGPALRPGVFPLLFCSCHIQFLP